MPKRGLILFLLAFLLLSGGCRKEIISETEAVASARALLTQAYGEIPAEAEVRFIEAPRGGLYEIYIPQRENYDFFARVEAGNGRAYQAARRKENLPLTEAQQAEADALGDMDAYGTRFDGHDACKEAAVAFAEDRFAGERAISRVEFNYDMTDNIQFPLVDVGYLIYFDGGDPLHVEVVWPQLAVFSVGYGEP